MLLKKRKRFKFERRWTPWCFGFSAVSNEYIKTPEDTSREYIHCYNCLHVTIQPHPIVYFANNCQWSTRRNTKYISKYKPLTPFATILFVAFLTLHFKTWSGFSCLIPNFSILWYFKSGILYDKLRLWGSKVWIRPIF